MGITFSDSSRDISVEYAYHILRVQQNSPAQLAGLQPFFDFILAVNGRSATPEQPHQLHRQLSSHLGRPVELSVYSSKLRSLRRVSLTPRDDWGGQGLLGASARLCTSAGSPVTAWRVLDTAPGSPADLAGLRPGVDYIVGADDAPLHSPEDLCDLIEARLNSPLVLYVYCSRADCCREVTVRPNPAWGGEGALGCGIGYGYLHQIPCGGVGSGDGGDSELVPGGHSNHLPANLPSAPQPAAESAPTASVTVV